MLAILTVGLAGIPVSLSWCSGCLRDRTWAAQEPAMGSRFSHHHWHPLCLNCTDIKYGLFPLFCPSFIAASVKWRCSVQWVLLHEAQITGLILEDQNNTQWNMNEKLRPENSRAGEGGMMSGSGQIPGDGKAIWDVILRNHTKIKA